MKRIVWQFGASALVMTAAGLARAQDEAPAPAAEPAPAPAPAEASASASGGMAFGGSTAGSADASGNGGGGMTLPGAAPAAAVAGDSEHDQMIGRVAIGYLGRRTVLFGTPGGPAPAEAPVVGIRYWVDEMLGIDAGLGFSYVTTGSTTAAGDGPSPKTMGFLIHGGVPLSLASSGHFSFQIVPELNVGFSSFSQNDPAGDLNGSGFHLDVGARAGAEIHFGFIGIPELSLQGSVGLGLTTESWSYDQDNNPGSQNDGSRFSIATSVQDSPWNIFRSNVAALYYF